MPHDARARPNPKRLSLDSLPAYSSAPAPRDIADHPPDYPDSADDADNEDAVQEILYSTRPPLSPPLSPRRRPRPSSRRTPRKSIYSSSQSASSDTYLDALLERSVRALEMSNLILQSAAPSPLPYQQSHQLHMENVIDNALHWQAHALDQRIKGSRDVMDELDSLVASVNDLIGEPISSSTYPMSTSLPTSSSPAMQYRRRHSVEDRPLSPQDSPRLRYASDERAHRAPPPRALTQYVSVGSSNGDEEASQEGAQEIVFLPSTLGQRASPIRSPLPSRTRARSYSHDFTPHTEVGSPRARDYLSQAIRVASPLSPASPSPLSRSRSDSARAKESKETRTTEPGSREPSQSRRSSSPRRSMDKRPMTPHLEISTPPSSPESSLDAPQTVERLRKILEHSTSPDSSRAKVVAKPPALMYKGHGLPIEAQEVSTTASISRLFTRSTHHSSTSAPFPSHSSLKPPASPLLSAGQLSPPSGPSSGRSTPRLKVQFADLPESYSTSRRGSKSKSKKAAKDTSWWSSFWTTDSSSLVKKNDERPDDKLGRGWGRPSFGSSTLDDWTV